MLARFLPRSRSAIVATCVAGGLVLAGGGIATGAALATSAGSAGAAATPTRGATRHAEGASPKAPASEIVTAVTSGSVTVGSRRGSKTIGLTGATTYREGKAAVSVSALQPGEKVRIRIVPGTASHPVARTVTIVPARAGTAPATA